MTDRLGGCIWVGLVMITVALAAILVISVIERF